MSYHIFALYAKNMEHYSVNMIHCSVLLGTCIIQWVGRVVFGAPTGYDDFLVNLKNQNLKSFRCVPNIKICFRNFGIPCNSQNHFLI